MYIEAGKERNRISELQNSLILLAFNGNILIKSIVSDSVIVYLISISEL